MKVRHLLIASLVLTGAGHALELTHGGTAQAADKPAAGNVLEFNDCMRTDRITNYAVVDDRNVVVANGPNFFQVTTNVDCPRMGLGGGVHFKTAESSKAIGEGRICGTPTEKIVRINNDPPCNIESVKVIDKATYKAMEKKAKLKGAGPGTSGATP